MSLSVESKHRNWGSLFTDGNNRAVNVSKDCWSAQMFFQLSPTNSKVTCPARCPVVFDLGLPETNIVLNIADEWTLFNNGARLNWDSEF